MPKASNYIVLLLAIVTLSSCGTSNNYLSSQYKESSNNTNSLPVQSRAKNLYAVKVSLKKPKINYDDKITPIVDTNRAKVLEKLENNSFTSYFDLTVNKLIHEAETYLGTPYRFGGTTRSGIDCSAFMQRIYEAEGIELPRISSSQANIGVRVTRDELQKGDLIFFSTTSRSRVTHVGMVYDVQDGKVRFIHASSSKGVTVSDLDESYWNSRYRTARRVEEFATPQLVKNSELKNKDI
ncbi:C40 family peptidase [Ornithobacterium rhinotracheale]